MTGYATRKATPIPSFGMTISENDNHYHYYYLAWKPFSSHGVIADGAFACGKPPANMDITFEHPVKISSIDCHIMSGWGFSTRPNIAVLVGEDFEREKFIQSYVVPDKSSGNVFTPVTISIQDPEYSNRCRVQISPAFAAICAVKLHAVYRPSDRWS